MANRKFRSQQDIELWLNFASSALHAVLLADVSEVVSESEDPIRLGVITAFDVADAALNEAHERMDDADLSDWVGMKTEESN